MLFVLFAKEFGHSGGTGLGNFLRSGHGSDSRGTNSGFIGAVTFRAGQETITIQLYMYM